MIDRMLARDMMTPWHIQKPTIKIGISLSKYLNFTLRLQGQQNYKPFPTYCDCDISTQNVLIAISRHMKPFIIQSYAVRVLYNEAIKNPDVFYSLTYPFDLYSWLGVIISLVTLSVIYHFAALPMRENGWICSTLVIVSSSFIFSQVNLKKVKGITRVFVLITFCFVIIVNFYDSALKSLTIVPTFKDADLTFQDLRDRGFQFVVHSSLGYLLRYFLKAYSDQAKQSYTWGNHKVLVDNMMVFNDTIFAEMFMDPRYSQIEVEEDYPVDKILLKRYFRRNFFMAKDHFFISPKCIILKMLNLDKAVDAFENLQSAGIIQYWKNLEQEILGNIRKSSVTAAFKYGLAKGVIAEPEVISETELQGVKLDDSVIQAAFRLCIFGFALSLFTLVVCEFGKKFLPLSKCGV
ncbi:unnamed protein product [Allacma fusca]|uniref:Uncharacterized protein n=1 Tax=Allacma fusca TaxID=39272 RepID=A0A8J2KHA5_9HEXA|nr:unnamed protein product [Allacma fusca]